MTGAKGPHLQRRNGIFHLRVRVPDDVKLRLNMSEVRRSLGTYNPTRARTLAAIYAARVKKVFEMTKMIDLSTERARQMVRNCFRDLIAETDSGIILPFDEMGRAVEEQHMLSQEHVLKLRQGMESGKFGGEVHVTTAQCTAAAGMHTSALTPMSLLRIQEGVARALIEQERLFQLRLDDRFAPFAPADPLFGEIDCTELDGSPASHAPGLKHVKSLAGIREVPIHPDVIALGFGKFVATRRKRGKPTDRLFPEIEYGKDGQASTTYSKLFGRIMDQCGLTDPTLVFHSFRHNAEDGSPCCAAFASPFIEEVQMDYADLISEHDFATVVGLTIWGVRAWRKRGYGPGHKKLGKRVFYSRREINQFLSSGLGS